MNKKTLFVAISTAIVLCLATNLTDELRYEHTPSGNTSGSLVGTTSDKKSAVSEPLKIAKSVVNLVSESKELSLNAVADAQPLLVLGYITTEFGVLPIQSKIKLYSPSLNKGYVTRQTNTGNFQFDNVVPASDYQLTVIPKGMYYRYHEKNVRIESNQSQLLVTLDVLPVDKLNGLVVNIDGVPVPNFDVHIRSKTKTFWNRKTATNAIGQFTLENVPIGGLEFSSMLGQVMSTTGYFFDGNEQSLLTLVVDNGPHEITGLVFNQYNEPVPGANVIFGWKTSAGTTYTASYRRTTTNMGGYFSVKGIGPGKHDLVVSDSVGATHRQSVEISDRLTDFTIVLTENPLFN